nr:bifunctional helix-turn-helix transcriptional regulator/GNAT family N-acetyltransferase [Allomuricauda sp.]
MTQDFLVQLKQLGFTARIKRLHEKIVSSTVDHYAAMNLDIEPNWHVIFLLLKEKEKQSITDLSNALGFTHPAIIKMIRKMAERGYVERYKDPMDNRRTLVQLTSKGIQRLPLLETEWQRIGDVLKTFVDDDFLDGLTHLEHRFEQKSFRHRYQNKHKKAYQIRLARPSEFKSIGDLLVQVYSRLEGFPKPHEHLDYYQYLSTVGELTQKTGVELWVAVSEKEEILGAVLYFSIMEHYGSGGSASQQKNASGFRLLAVSERARGLGIGKALIEACISKARKDGNAELIIHSTEYMSVAWKMYERLGFKKSPDLDFNQAGVSVYGFRLPLK